MPFQPRQPPFLSVQVSRRTKRSISGVHCKEWLINGLQTIWE